MTRRALALAAAGGLALGGLAFVVGVVAWPEMAASGYFLSLGWRLYEEVVQQYTPLLMYAVAAAGSLFGFDGTTFRLVVALPLFAQGLLLGVGVLRGRLSTGRLTVWLAALGAVAAWTAYFDAFAIWPDAALAPFALGTVLLLEEFERSGRTRPLASAGLLLGIGILVKQTFAWTALGGAAWLLLASRRRTARRAVVLAVAVAAPCLAFWAAWAAAFGTTAHFRWTFVLPLTRHTGDMGVAPGGQDLLEAVAPFLVLAAAAVLVPPLVRRRAPSPLPWVTLATVAMAWPRWGLLHLAATTGLLALALARALRTAVAASRRFRRPGHRTASRAPLLGAGLGLLATHVAVAIAGGGVELTAQAGGGVRYWDEPPLVRLAAETADRVGRGQELLSYFATNDNIYVRSRTVPPGRLYVNIGFWFFLREDGLDERLTTRLSLRPGLPVLFRGPVGEDLEHARRTRIWRFLDRNTRVLSGASEDAEWREVARSAADSGPGRRTDGLAR